MNITRRDLFKGTALLGTTLFSTKGKAFSNPDTDYRFPVLQGATSHTKTQISVMAAEDIVISVPGQSVDVQVVEKNYSVWKAYRVVVDGLTPDTEYELHISNPSGVVLDTRKFSALSLKKSQVRVAMASCMRDTRADHQASMWLSMAESKPDLLFLLGDNVYVDDETSFVGGVTEERIWRRYVETRLTLDLYHFRKLVPTLATWDDHDFGLNNTYGATPWREASTSVFRTLYAQDAIMPEVTWGPGIATSYSAYGQRFYLMDNRSFREHRYIGKEHWGTSQEEWLFTDLSSDKSAGWIFTGSQVFGGYRLGWAFEETNAAALKKVLARLKKIEAPVLFGSGDVHYSEIMKIESELLGYETIEICSSSMHSNAKEPQKGNRRRVKSTGEFNFVVADVEVVPKGLSMNLHSFGKGGAEYFELEKVKVLRS